MTEPRLPYHDRALELFRQGFDLGSARLIAASELADQQRARNDVEETRPGKVWRPKGRMVGAGRQG